MQALVFSCAWAEEKPRYKYTGRTQTDLREIDTNKMNFETNLSYY